jgi:hypothetical protein
MNKTGDTFSLNSIMRKSRHKRNDHALRQNISGDHVTGITPGFSRIHASGRNRRCDPKRFIMEFKWRIVYWPRQAVYPAIQCAGIPGFSYLHQHNVNNTNDIRERPFHYPACESK